MHICSRCIGVCTTHILYTLFVTHTHRQRNLPVGHMKVLSQQRNSNYLANPPRYEHTWLLKEMREGTLIGLLHVVPRTNQWLIKRLKYCWLIIKRLNKPFWTAPFIPSNFRFWPSMHLRHVDHLTILLFKQDERLPGNKANPASAQNVFIWCFCCPIVRRPHHCGKHEES